MADFTPEEVRQVVRDSRKCVGADLRDIDLSDANLREAILNGAFLQGANLSRAIPFGASHCWNGILSQRFSQWRGSSIGRA
ncbi:MAG: pentapeptide repeat-containing protein, partial [Anaerolineales bacterium]|nr:pentapeptide repeat-containing protein [Anaerolineales bacterium]